MEWISVKDRLPEVGQMVLWFCDDEIGIGTYTSLDDGFTDAFSHWMPLPQPPKV